MGRLFALVALTLVLVGCGKGTSNPTPIPTPDTSTVPGYRQATEARGEQVRAAIETLHAGCASGEVDKCTAALKAHESAIAEPEKLIRTTKAPQGCVPLFGGYAGLMDNAFDYRTAIQSAIATRNIGTIAAADKDRYKLWTEGWASNAKYLQTDPCK